MSLADTCTRLDWPTAVMAITCVLIGSLSMVVMVRGWPRWRR